MSYVSSIGAYSAASAITPVRPNQDYAVDREAGKAAPPEQPAGFGPATKVTLSPEAQAYLQSQKADQVKADQAKAAEAKKTEEAEAQEKAEKAAAARKAGEAQRAEQAEKASQA